MSNHNHQNKKTTDEDAQKRSEPVAQSTAEASVPANKEASRVTTSHQPSTNEEPAALAETKRSDPKVDAADSAVPVGEPESPAKVSTPDTPASTAALAETKVGGFGWLLRVGVNAAVVTAVAALILVMIGFAQRSEWVTANGFSGGESETVADASGGEEKRYICPMMCTPPSTEPGRCPVCAMELVFKPRPAKWAR